MNTNRLMMWTERRDFEIYVEQGWQLWLDRKLKISVAEGSYFGMLGDGFEIRKDKNFICQRPLYVCYDDPHQHLLQLWSAKQTIYYRDDCKGYIPKGLRPKSREPELWEVFDDETDDDDYHDYNDDYVDTKDDEFIDYYEEKFYGDDEYDDILKVPIKDSRASKIKIRRSDSMYLGPKLPKDVRLYLQEVIQGLYTVHEENNGTKCGYLIHLTEGIAGPDFEGFHSDEGYYEVGVVQNALYNPVDFIGLLGNQNELNWYELDDFIKRVGIDDLFWFDKYVKKFLTMR